jgi:hypothetical protein
MCENSAKNKICAMRYCQNHSHCHGNAEEKVPPNGVEYALDSLRTPTVPDGLATTPKSCPRSNSEVFP